MKQTLFISEQLAQCAVHTAYHDIPENLMNRTKYLVLDAIGMSMSRAESICHAVFNLDDEADSGRFAGLLKNS